MRVKGSRRWGARAGGAFLALAVAVLVGAMTAGTASAVNAKTALVLASSVSGSISTTPSLEENRLLANGFTITEVTDAQWAAMTATQFAQYQEIVIGDPTCGVLSPVVGANAANLASAVMGTAPGGGTMAGNRILIGTDPVFHTHFTKPQAENIIKAGIDFAGAQPGVTGLYFDPTCQDPSNSASTLLPLLTITNNPVWTENHTPPCGGSVSLISNAAQFSIVHSSDLQGWFCSTHESFPSFPSDWNPLAVATDTPTHPTCGNDVDTGAAVCGEAYILIAGSGIVATAPNLSLSPTSATNTVNTSHTVTATVTNPDNTPAAGVHVTFTVTGANAGASGTCVPATCNTDANGHVTFTYTGTNTGDDTINASITVGGSTQTATAAKKWVAAGGGDTTPPTCVLSSKVAGPPAQIQVTLQDTGSGLASIVVTTSTNADTVVPPFVAGTNGAVVVTATKIDQSQGASVALSATDVAGNTVNCDPNWPAKHVVKAKAHRIVKKASHAKKR